MKKILFLLITVLSFGLGFGQVTIAKQSFETSGDTWTPLTFSTPPCTNGSDEWDYDNDLSTIDPASDGTRFWGIRDLNGNCGGSGFETIFFPDINVSSYSNVMISFDYNAIGLDNNDDIKYVVYHDNIAQSEVVLVDGNANYSTGGWLTETIVIPNTVNVVRFELKARQNGGSDYIGFDNVLLKGTAAGCSISSLGLTNVSCDDNGTTGVTTDDRITFDLNPTGSGLGATYNVTVSGGAISPALNIAYGSATSFTMNNGSAGNGNVTVTITDVTTGTCTDNVIVTDPGTCSTPPYAYYYSQS